MGGLADSENAHIRERAQVVVTAGTRESMSRTEEATLDGGARIDRAQSARKDPAGCEIPSMDRCLRHKGSIGGKEGAR